MSEFLGLSHVSVFFLCVCVCVCVCMRICMCMFMCMCAYTIVCVCMCMCVRLFVVVSAWMCSVCVYIYIHVSVCLLVCFHICLYALPHPQLPLIPQRSQVSPRQQAAIERTLPGAIGRERGGKWKESERPLTIAIVIRQVESGEPSLHLFLHGGHSSLLVRLEAVPPRQLPHACVRPRHSCICPQGM
jgi:hypothetical protein